MKMKNKVLSRIIAITQSKWIRPELMTLALVAVLLGVAGCNGCSSSNESGHHRDYGNHRN